VSTECCARISPCGSAIVYFFGAVHNTKKHIDYKIELKKKSTYLYNEQQIRMGCRVLALERSWWDHLE
jgi:hypothetical protein